MENENSLLWEVTFWEFLFVTVLLAGAAAYLTGRAAARTWLPKAQLAFYVLLLTAATRFIHFALFNGTLLSLQYFVVDLIVLLAIAFGGMRITRAYQMSTQYSFAFLRSGPFGWKQR
ncbi:MAG: hypothetical protein RIB55_01890 [Nitratireductor sp.]|jgi:ABC-type amino acid transport substrate-binding protein